MSDYMKLLDETNAKIIEGLGKYGPRNTVSLAKSIGLPRSTVAFRIKKLKKNVDLEVNARVDFTKLGLKRAIVIAETLPGKWNKLWEVFENLRYLTYLTKCHGRFYGCYAIFAFPVEYKAKLKEYFEEAKRLKALSRYLLFWITNLCEVYPNFDWFNFKEKKWAFEWSKWVEEISKASERLPECLIDPKEYPIMADGKDLLILRELEKNGMIEFNELAKIISITPQSAAHRYYKHILKRNLVIDYDVKYFPYSYQISDTCIFFIGFKDEKALAKFGNTLDDKPFVLSYGKVLGENTLIANTYTPKAEFRNLIESLERLAEMNFVKNFFHVMLTLLPHKRGGVPYEFFKNGAWQYNRKENLERLRKIVGQ